MPQRFRTLRGLRKLWARLRGDAGASTAEYAVVVVAAAAFGGILLKIVTSPPVQAALTGIIERALK